MLSSAAAVAVWAASSLPAPRALLPEDLSDRRLNCRCWCWDSRHPTSAFLRTFFSPPRIKTRKGSWAREALVLQRLKGEWCEGGETLYHDARLEKNNWMVYNFRVFIVVSQDKSRYNWCEALMRLNARRNVKKKNTSDACSLSTRWGKKTQRCYFSLFQSDTEIHCVIKMSDSGTDLMSFLNS